jgi:hypothetical protein
LLSVLGGTFHTGPLWDVVVFDADDAVVVVRAVLLSLLLLLLLLFVLEDEDDDEDDEDDADDHEDDDLLDFPDLLDLLDLFDTSDDVLDERVCLGQEESTSEEDEDGGVLSAFATVVVTAVGAGLANNSSRLRTYALSARATGSPSFTKLRNSDLLSSGLPSGFRSGRRDTGGAPNVTQWTRLKRPVRAFSSDRAGPVAEESMCAYRSAATAPPAEWPVMRRE